MKKILFIIGTRPELIKLAPVINTFKNNGAGEKINVLFTSQHKDILKKYSRLFNIFPDYELDFMMEGQSLGMLTSRAFAQTDAFFSKMKLSGDLPEIIIVQGDTTTVFSVSLCAFYHEIKIAHVEAGLRTYDLKNPFPEEFNRRAVSIIADINFSPTKLSTTHLINEGIKKESIETVGNTVVDALQFIVRSDPFNRPGFSENILNQLPLKKGNVILITFHRRENQNQNLLEFISALKILADKHPSLYFIWTLHPNPKIKTVVENSELFNHENVIKVPPLEYLDLLKLMNLSKIILSDSGGIQEEAPSFGVPVMVLRKTTERPEGILSKKSFLTELKTNSIINKFEDLFKNYKSRDFTNPYGDGHSSERIYKKLMSILK